MNDQHRARDLGINCGVLSPGQHNAITDVLGVRVGQITLVEGQHIRTGVTAILAHPGNLHAERVPAGISVGNGYGKLAGSTQIAELGELESPIVLTNTLAIGAAVEGVVRWTLAQPGNEQVRSVNAVVGETNDGYLNDIRALAVRPEHVIRALQSATAGPVAEGSVGAGTGTQALGWKAGIGTSSRRIPTSHGEFTVGALVQTNFGGILTIGGVVIGPELAADYLPEELTPPNPDGSIMIVIATDAPVSDRNLNRLARRAFLGLGRTGSCMSNGSGDYAIAFSTSLSVRRLRDERGLTATESLRNEAMSPLFLGAVEATTEAIYNSLFCATTVEAHRGLAKALPILPAVEILRRHRLLQTHREHR